MHGKNSLNKDNAKNNGKKTLNPALLLFLVILVVAVSGCISSLGFGPQQQTVEAPNDVMSFSDNTVIPNPPILTGDTFTTSFAMKNLDNFDDANNVKLELYDWGVCNPSSCTPAKSGGTGWDAIDGKSSSYSTSFGAVSPNDVQQVECQFKSPPSEKIGGLQANCPIRYKLTYDFSGITTTDLNVISNKKFQEMSRAGQTPSTTSTLSKSRGPIKVDFSFGANQPVRTSTADSLVKIPMYITVENKGSGNVNIDNVGYVLLLKVFIPSDLVPNKDCEAFKCEDWLSGQQAPLPEGGYDPNKCVLILNDNKKITKDMFVKDKVQSFRCELTSPDENKYKLEHNNQDFEQKTYSIQSEVKYTYQLDNDFNVAIKPMTTG